MVKAPYFDSNGIKKGAWDREEDDRLNTFIHRYGHNMKISWRLVPIYAGLKRCGKSCRLRWVNYLNPDLRRGDFTKQEHDLIVELHEKHGSRWSTIAASFPGRTDNDIKNYWHGHIKKRSPKQSKKAIDKLKQARNEEPSSSMSDHHNSKSSSDNLTEPSSSKNCISSEESFDAQENLSTELISDSWDPIRELSESFDFGIFQDTESWNSFTNPISYSNGELLSGSFCWGETSYVIEPEVYGSEEISYDIFSNGSPGFWDSMSTTCFN